MNFLRHLTALAILMDAGTGFAQTTEFSSPEAAIAAMFPNEEYVEWTSAHGDWNADGAKDLAMILVRSGASTYDSSSIRLVVLAGMSEGKLTPLSVSSSYCSAQKFFNLEAKGRSLFVSEVHKSDSDGQATNTLQFRFNSKLGDFELIGREDVWESFHENIYGRMSVNYLNGASVEYERLGGRVKEKTNNRFSVSQLARLSMFDCDGFFSGRQ